MFGIFHFFKTPTGLSIDLRLFDSSLRDKVTPMLESLLELNQDEKKIIEKLKEETVSYLKSK